VALFGGGSVSLADIEMEVVEKDSIWVILAPPIPASVEEVVCIVLPKNDWNDSSSGWGTCTRTTTFG